MIFSKAKKVASVIGTVATGVIALTSKDSILVRAGEEIGDALFNVGKQKNEQMQVKHQTRMLEEKIKQAELRHKLRQMEGDNYQPENHEFVSSGIQQNKEKRGFFSKPTRSLR